MLDPIGGWREDFRLAYLCSLITNIALAIHGKQGSPETKPLDFMFEWGEEEAEEIVKQSTNEMKNAILSIVNNWGARNKMADPSKFKYTNKNRL